MKEYFSIDGNKLLNTYYTIKLIEGFTIFKGQYGLKGERGYEGTRGLQGLQGERGYQGLLGENGIRGVQGYRGNEGNLGEKGIEGPPGYDGERGFPGFRGQKGKYGNRGPPGFPGEKGEKGVKGPIGYKGLVGEPGEQGDDPNPQTNISEISWITGYKSNGYINDPRDGNMVETNSMFFDPITGQQQQGATVKFNKNVMLKCPYNSYINAFAYQSQRPQFLKSRELNNRNYQDEDTPGYYSPEDYMGLPYNFNIHCLKINQ